MVEERSLSSVYGKLVYNDAGKLFGRVQDVLLGKYAIHGWIIAIPPESYLRSMLPSVRAVIVPHKAVKAVGDILIVSSKISLPATQGSQVEGELKEE